MTKITMEIATELSRRKVRVASGPNGSRRLTVVDNGYDESSVSLTPDECVALAEMLAPPSVRALATIPTRADWLTHRECDHPNCEIGKVRDYLADSEPPF